ncbi:solute carrier family 22 member 15-like [Elysia marginata]|uniref:Solute carrier family 22 member 15-like n=1 Tax=Elysia marginata TaxID=1093978 RepID=A0AAV4FU18_9GAST|nr:solute carrier family 22 member 15-like [Elysia marginata]
MKINFCPPGQTQIASLDDVIQDIGACGVFQGLLVLALHTSIFVSVWGIMMMAFGSFNPGWVCLDSLLDGIDDGSPLLSTDLTSSNNATEELNGTDRCSLYKTCANLSFSSGTSTVASEWGLVCDQAWALKVIFTVQMAGVFVGAYLSGHIGECVGRKASLYSMILLNGVANFLAIFSPSWKVFAAIRFFIGLAAGGIMLPAYAMPPEFAGQFWRGVITSLPTWNFGAALFAISVILLKDWRHLHILSAVVSGLVFLPVFWVPESFRWLAVHGRDKDATAVVTKIARMNGRPKPSLEILVNMAECERRRVAVEGSGQYSYLDLFRDSHVRKATLIMSFVWFSSAIVYYGISFNVQALSGDYYINFLILSVIELPSPLICFPTVTYFSRRWGTAFLFFIVSVACFGITIVTLALESDKEDESRKVTIVVTLASVAKIAIVSSWAVVALFCAELFPTAVRNLGFGFINSLARLGSYVGPMLFPQDPALLYLAMIVLGVLNLVCSVLHLLLPETKGKPLEDILRSKALHLRIDGMALTKKQNGEEMEEEENHSYQA